MDLVARYPFESREPVTDALELVPRPLSEADQL
jgi:hypothetical protein